MQTDVTFLPKNSQHWWMLLRFAHSLACWCLSLGVVAQSLKPVKLFSQQLPTVLLLRDRLRVAQQCWIRLHCSSHIVGARHVRAWFYGLYPSHAIAQKLSVSNGNGFSNRNLKPNAKTRFWGLLVKTCGSLNYIDHGGQLTVEKAPKFRPGIHRFFALKTCPHMELSGRRTSQPLKRWLVWIFWRGISPEFEH